MEQGNEQMCIWPFDACIQNRDWIDDVAEEDQSISTKRNLYSIFAAFEWWFWWWSFVGCFGCFRQTLIYLVPHPITITYLNKY